MNRFLRIGLFAIGLGMLMMSVSATDANAQGPLTEILRRMDLSNKALQSLTASVTMVKTNTQLGLADTTVGTMSYLPKTAQHPMYIRIDWTKPLEEHMSVIGDKYELYRPRLQQVIRGKTDSAKNNAAAGGALGFISMSKDQLKTNYDLTYVDRELLNDGTKTSHIHLTPKMTTSYKSAELWVDDDGFPRQALITEKNNDTTNVLLSDIKKNLTINASIFTLKYDKGKVKVISN